MRGCILAGLTLLPALSVPVPGQTATLDELLEERARVRLREVRIRIEPRYGEEPEACDGIGLADLKVRLRGEEVPAESLVDLERSRTPTLHGLLLDTSWSMLARLDTAREALTAYVDTFDPAVDRAMLATFDDSVILARTPTADIELLREGIASLRIGGSTSMLDGLLYTIDEIAAHRERPVAIVLSDGVDTSSMHQLYDVRDRLALRPDLTIFPIYLMSSGRQPLSSKKRLQNLARRSHGRYFEISAPSRLPEIYRTIRAMLDNEAVLSFLDPEPESEIEGRIRVGSRDPSCSVETFTADPDEDAPEPPSPIAAPYPSPPSSLDLDPSLARFKGRGGTEMVWVDDSCAPADEESPPRWYLDIDRGQVRGCTLDIAFERGVLYDPLAASSGRRFYNSWIVMKTRPLDVPLPAVDSLPAGPEGWMDAVAAGLAARGDGWPRPGTRVCRGSDTPARTTTCRACSTVASSSICGSRWPGRCSPRRTTGPGFSTGSTGRPKKSSSG